MRVLMVGAHNEQVATAARIAVRRGAMLRQVATPESAIEELCAGRRADLQLAERRWTSILRSEGIVVRWSPMATTLPAVVAITAGATEFLRLPADPELIAAILDNVGDERRLAFDGRPCATCWRWRDRSHWTPAC